jgi:hypothetical protein
MTKECNQQRRNENAYRQEQEVLKQTLQQNEFHFFLTLRDNRPSDRCRSFRRTDDTGYANRDQMITRIMGVFRKCYRIRSPRGSARRSNSEYFDVAIHEAGNGRSHVLTEDAAHLHLAIGFTKESKYYKEPLKHFAEFQKAMRRVFPWLDCCFSLRNRGAQILIEDQASVAAYMSKHEKGVIEGEPFMKRPIVWNAPSLDTVKLAHTNINPQI